MEKRNEIIQAMKDNHLYDYVANNYYNFSKEELRDIILELDYLLFVHDIKERDAVPHMFDRWPELYKSLYHAEWKLQFTMFKIMRFKHKIKRFNERFKKKWCRYRLYINTL